MESTAIEKKQYQTTIRQRLPNSWASSHKGNLGRQQEQLCEYYKYF